jgi:hypothetical protein
MCQAEHIPFIQMNFTTVPKASTGGPLCVFSFQNDGDKFLIFAVCIEKK